MEYEKERLQKLSKKIKQISLIDVSAGYDILSFNDDMSSDYDRFIEVKSFRGEPHFYWSINEKNISEFMGDKYFIYLVDLDSYNSDRAIKPIIIKNPAQNLEQRNWLIEPTNYLVYEIN